MRVRKDESVRILFYTYPCRFETMMHATMVSPLPKSFDFPESLPKEGALSLELHEGVPTLRASKSVQSRIDMLLRKQQTQPLSAEEENDLDGYEAIDDYISLLNRISRNLFSGQEGIVAYDAAS